MGNRSDRQAQPKAGVSLPAPGTRAWGSAKKAAVVLGIRNGLITRDQAYAAYSLSPEELASWEAAFDNGGQRALSIKSARQRASSAGPRRQKRSTAPTARDVQGLIPAFKLNCC